MRSIACAFVFSAAPVSAQVDVDSLQNSLKSGGVEGLSRMLAAMASSGAMKTSDASLHIKKDENGNAMYDFRDIESPTMPPASPAAPPEPLSAAPTEPAALPTLPQVPPQDTLPKVDFGIIEKPAQDTLPKMNFGIAEKPAQEALPQVNFGIVERPVQRHGQVEAHAAVHLVATKAQIPPMEPEQSHYIEWGGTPKHSKHAAPADDVQQDNSEDVDEPAALPVESAQVAQVAQAAGQAAGQADPSKLVDLTHGLESMKSSMETLIGEATAAMKAQPAAATTSSDVLARLNALESENAKARSTMEKQASELLRVESEQKEEESEIKELRAENQQLRGKVQAGHKAMLLSTNSEERAESASGIRTYFHRKSKRSHRHHH